MRRRLVILGLATVVAVLLAVGLPFGATIARFRVLREQDRERAIAVSVAADAVVLVPGELRNALAQIVTNRSSAGRRIAVLGKQAEVLAATGLGPVPVGTPPAPVASYVSLRLDEQDLLRRSLRGFTPGSVDYGLLPKGELAVAVPIRRGEETIGAVLILTDAGPVRRDILHAWGRLVAGGLAMVLVSIAAARPITRWIIRPLADLERLMLQVVQGDESSRFKTVRGPTEVQSLGRRFNEMADEVQIVLQRQRRFAADAAHQLRNPLTALHLRSDALAMSIEELERAQHEGRSAKLAAIAVEHAVLNSEISRMETIVEQLLAVSSSARPVTTDVEPVHTIVDGQRLQWGALAKARRVSVEVGPVPPVGVILQSGGLAQILDVLVDNATKYAPVSTSVTLSFFHVPERRLLIITVSNEVAGRSNDDDRNDRTGHGLGLAIARGLVEASGGTLRIESSDAAGARVRVATLDLATGNLRESSNLRSGSV